MIDNPNISVLDNDGVIQHLENNVIPSISLPNQEGNLLRLDRSDTFRMILYFFPMTGRPDMPLPENWNSLPGASGCTLETCKFRDKYDDLISLNAIPIGITSQTVEYNKEMTNRLGIPFDVLSDAKLELKDSLSLPIFSIIKVNRFKYILLSIEKVGRLREFFNSNFASLTTSNGIPSLFVISLLCSTV